MKTPLQSTIISFGITGNTLSWPHVVLISCVPVLSKLFFFVPGGLIVSEFLVVGIASLTGLETDASIAAATLNRVAELTGLAISCLFVGVGDFSVKIASRNENC